MSKLQRFGPRSVSPRTGETAVSQIEEEIGDVLGGVKWLRARLESIGIVLDDERIEARADAKRAKYLAWQMQANGELPVSADRLSRVIHDIFSAEDADNEEDDLP